MTPFVPFDWVFGLIGKKLAEAHKAEMAELAAKHESEKATLQSQLGMEKAGQRFC